jgi:hypothetical protein
VIVEVALYNAPQPSPSASESRSVVEASDEFFLLKLAVERNFSTNC